MKSKKTTLLLGLCALLAGTTAAVICRSGVEMTTAVGCSHIGNHYSEYAATYEHSGVKEYWVCCSCHEHFLSEPQIGAWVNLTGVENPDIESTDDRYIAQLAHTFDDKWSHNEYTHWHACLDEGYENLKGDEEEHYDLDGDFECDVCERELDGVEITNIIMPVDRISIGEHTTLTAEVEAHGSYSDEVYWTLDTSTTRLSLVDNGDNTCTLTGLTGLVSSVVNSFKITAHSVDDTSVTKTVTFYASCFPKSRIQAIIDFVGEDYVLPYCDFKAVGDFTYESRGDYVSGYVKNNTGATNVIKAFDNNGTYEKSVVGSHTYYTKEMAGTDYCVQYDVYVSGGWSYVDVYRIEKPLTSFPIDKVTEFLGDDVKCSVIEPDDGTKFSVEESYISIYVYSDCDRAEYIDKLVTAGYAMLGDYDSATLISPDRTLVVEVYESYDETCFAYRAQEVPTDTDWSASDKNLMTEKLGLVLPFVNGDYEAWSYSSSANSMKAYANMVDAYLEAIRVFDAITDYTKTEVVSGVEYRKSVSDTEELVVTIDFYGTMIAKIEQKQSDERMPRAEIASYLQNISEEDIPSMTVGDYVISYADDEEHVVFVDATNSDFEAFKVAILALPGAEQIDDMGLSWCFSSGLFLDIVSLSSNAVFVINFYTA